MIYHFARVRKNSKFRNIHRQLALMRMNGALETLSHSFYMYISSRIYIHKTMDNVQGFALLKIIAKYKVLAISVICSFSINFPMAIFNPFTPKDLTYNSSEIEWVVFNS